MDASKTENDSNLTDFKFDDTTQRILVGTFFLPICITGILGNSLVIISVMLSRKLHSRSNAFVVSLSVADLATCIVGPASSAQLFAPLGVQIGPNWLCILVAAINTSSVTISVLTLASISLTRALVVARPLSARFPR